MVYRNNAGRLGSGFISVCLETRWLGQKSGFYVPERPCSQPKFLTKIWTLFPEKRRKMKSPQGWSVAKYWEFEGEIRWNGLYPFHEITAFTITLLDRIPRTVNSEEKFIESRLFSPSKFDSATGVTLTLYFRVVLIRIPNRNRNMVCNSLIHYVTICDICDGHKMSQFWICDLVCFSRFCLVFSAKQIWSHFGHRCHKWSHIQIWQVQTCLCCCFLEKGSEWMKSRKITQKQTLFLFSVWNPDQNGSHVLGNLDYKCRTKNPPLLPLTIVTTNFSNCLSRSHAMDVNRAHSYLTFGSEDKQWGKQTWHTMGRSKVNQFFHLNELMD